LYPTLIFPLTLPELSFVCYSFITERPLLHWGSLLCDKNEMVPPVFSLSPLNRRRIFPLFAPGRVFPSLSLSPLSRGKRWLTAETSSAEGRRGSGEGGAEVRGWARGNPVSGGERERRRGRRCREGLLSFSALSVSLYLSPLVSSEPRMQVRRRRQR